MFIAPGELVDLRKISTGCPWCKKPVSSFGIVYYRPYKVSKNGHEKIARKSDITRIFVHSVDLDGCAVTGMQRSICYDKKNRGLHRQLLIESDYYKSLHKSWIGERCPKVGCGRLITGIKYVGKSVDHDAAIFVHDEAGLGAGSGSRSSSDASSPKNAK